MALSGAQVTRLWPYGGPGFNYGDFSGKEESELDDPTAILQNQFAPIAIVEVSILAGFTNIQNARAPVAVREVAFVPGRTVVQNPQAPVGVVVIAAGAGIAVQNAKAPIAVIRVTPVAGQTNIQNPLAPLGVTEV